MVGFEPLLRLIAALTCSLILVQFGIPNSFINPLCNYFSDYVRIYTQELPGFGFKILKATCHASIMTVDYY